jgi:hypothetical protein
MSHATCILWPVAWNLYGVLHNLDLKTPFEAGWIAIVGSADPRLQAIADRNPGVRQLVDSFTDQFGRPKRISALIYDESASTELRTTEMVRAFHRIFAISSLTNGTSQLLRGRSFQTVNSSLFDLYPIFAGADGKALITFSEAVRDYNDDVGKFRGQTSPYVMNHPLMQPDPDLLLRGRLLDAWSRHGIRRGGDARFARIFRSLDVAYQAASLALESSAYEYGARVALWVSAIEILAHPGTKAGKVNLPAVVDLMESAAPRWSERTLRARTYVLRYWQTTRRVTLASRLYASLYKARNEFLHGNKVGPTALFVDRKKNRPGLPTVAPLIYEVSLLAALERVRDRRCQREHASQQLMDLVDQRFLEEALLKIKTG